MRAFIVWSCLLASLTTYGGEVQVSKKLQWAKTNKQIEVSPDKFVEALFLPGTFNDPKQNFLPVYQYNLQLSSDAVLDISLESSKFERVAKLPAGFNSSKLSSGIQFSYTIGYLKKKPVARITFIPVVKNAAGKIERLTEFQLKIDVMSTGKPRASTPTYASSSVLSSGSWYKVTVTADGVYKMDYNFLKSLGINASNINPNDIHVYGNGGGLLPEYNSAFRHDDLVEDPIIVSTATPGVFQQGDFVLFYGQSPNTWYYDGSSSHFLHQWNYYSNTNTYFITVNSTQGNRIGTLSQASNPNTTVTSFDDHQLYHSDNYNLIQSGLIWYTDMFNFSVTSETLNFNFPNLITGQPIYIGTDVAAASTADGSTFTFSVSGQDVITQSLTTVSGSSEDTYAQVASPTATFTTNSNPVNITVAFTNGSSSAQGWLDYIELNARRNLISTGAQMSFRDSRSVGANNVSTFNLQSVDANTHVLDVTDPTNAQMVSGTLNNGTFSFTLNTSTLHEFFIYQDNGTFPSPTPIGAIPNQNLHGINQATMVIVSDSSLMSAANSLAAYDRNSLKLNVIVVDKQQIFNEFSTGNQDITAIRDFVRMLYNRAGTDTAQMPQYLVLYGKASYDYKNIQANNTNFVPIYESLVSNDPINSICSDDYFGLLDPEEGSDNGSGPIGFGTSANSQPGYTEMVDIGIGRIPVTTVEEGNQVLAKIKNYAVNATMGSWRNDVTFVADDYDPGDPHRVQAEEHAAYMQENFPVFNVDKIYADAYKAITTPAGLRNPDVNAAIDAKVATGTLIMNWIGHGSSNRESTEKGLED